jgi:predicted adenine nucleotide alpha hydrolase (AANH) superfamily ATPase
METKGKILVHLCCAPCATASVERVLLDGYEPVLFFCNSNISPQAEYEIRLADAHKLAEKLEIVIEEDQYDHEAWLEKIQGLESEPEKGARCLKCFEFSLARTAELAERLGIPAFCTTLTVSPHKVSRLIFEIGSQWPGFIPIDFKKKGGFMRSLQLSDEMNLYRQNYCGCEFSIRA